MGYLEWLETLASLVNSGMVPISKIDNVMGYRYFLIVNNKQVQECELINNREFYLGIYALYPVWLAYKKKRNLQVIFEENDLRKTEGFAQIVSKAKKGEYCIRGCWFSPLCYKMEILIAFGRGICYTRRELNDWNAYIYS